MQFDLPPGTMLGKYEVLRKLAMGGMAEIYLARVRGTAGFEKLCVIKRILPTVANDPMFVQMFLDEARLAATLRHPNIADVYEVDEHAGSPFFAMEFIHGQDVRAVKRVGRERKDGVPLAIALAIVHGTASALDYAHDRTGPDGQNLGIVHRDVSTSNILVSYEGAIKLIDFGIARAASRTQQTQVGTLKGKIPYMSPEQCRGQSVDRRTDLWSLGVIMYELTTGRRPFTGENNFAIMDQIVHQPLRLPSELMRNYPPELEAIIAKLLARQPEQRYQTAEEVIADLDPFIAHHRLYVPAKPLSKYMRSVFETEVAAWDHAMEEGVTLSAHLAATVSGLSGPSDLHQLHTPPSSFPAVMPVSQEFPAVRVGSDPSLASLQPLRVDHSPPPALITPAPTAPPVVEIDRGGRKLAFALVGLLALGGGAYAGLTFLKKDRSSPTAASTAPAGDMPPTQGSTVTLPAAPAPTPEPTAAAPTPAEPAPVAKPDDKPADTPPGDSAEAATEEPLSGDAKPVAQVIPTEQVKAPPPRTPPPIRTNAGRPPKKDPPKKDPPKKDPPKKDPPKDTPKDPPKDPQKDTKKDPNQPWDKDSPFLPGQ